MNPQFCFLRSFLYLVISTCYISQYVPSSTFDFPQTNGRRCKLNWFSTWKWLHYSSHNDALLCYECMTANSKGHLDLVKSKDPSFISSGFRNWKKATGSDGAFAKHERSECHRVAVTSNAIPQRDVAEMLNASVTVERITNSKMLLKIIETVHFLGKQGLGFRGSHTSDSSFNEETSNFMRLLNLRSGDIPGMEAWLTQKKSYTSGEIQNELIQLIANSILRSKVKKIKEHKYYTIMVDETRDISNREQAVICLRHVGDDLVPHEDFIGLHDLVQTTSDSIVSMIIDIITRLDLRVADIRGQCYDGAATMKGSLNGVAKQISDKNAKAIYIHCYGHSLNLAVQDAVKGSPCLKNALDISNEIIKLVKNSPKRQAALENIKSSNTSHHVGAGIRALCPTRWTVKAAALSSILSSYCSLMTLWNEALDDCGDSELRARLYGVRASMRSFDFFFGLQVAIRIFRLTDNLSTGLQKSTLTAAEGAVMAKSTVDTLRKVRVEAKEFVESIIEKAKVEAAQVVNISYTSQGYPDFYLNNQITFTCTPSGFTDIRILELIYDGGPVFESGCSKDIEGIWGSRGSPVINEVPGINSPSITTDDCTAIAKPEGFTLEVQVIITNTSVSGKFYCRGFQPGDVGAVTSSEVTISSIKVPPENFKINVHPNAEISVGVEFNFTCSEPNAEDYTINGMALNTYTPTRADRVGGVTLSCKYPGADHPNWRLIRVLHNISGDSEESGTSTKESGASTEESVQGEDSAGNIDCITKPLVVFNLIFALCLVT